jgi:DedD protein
LNPATKQRLVGTIVLGALALILISLLLDGDGVDPPPLQSTLPPLTTPPIASAPLPEPERPAIVADSLAVDTVTPEASPEPPLDDTDPADSAAAAIEPATAPAAAPDQTDAPAPVAVARSISGPALDAAGLPEAWVVRLGIFGERRNADALMDRLLAADHKAFIRPVQAGERSFQGVFVGPVLTRDEATVLQGDLKTRFGIEDAIVQRFDPAQ